MGNPATVGKETIQWDIDCLNKGAFNMRDEKRKSVKHYSIVSIANSAILYIRNILISRSVIFSHIQRKEKGKHRRLWTC
jgi:hypothetical protein